MSKKRKRFTLRQVELLATVALAIVFAFVWSHAYGVLRSAQDNPAATTYRQYVDTANVYAIVYPDNWTLDYPVGGRDYSGDERTPGIDWSKTSRVVLLKPATGHKNNDVMIMADCNAGSIAQQKMRADKFHAQQAMRINDYDTLYDKLTFQGDAESYLHHTYVLEYGGKCVSISYRENWHHPMSGTNFDDHQNLSAFEAIVRSIKFL